MSSDVVKKILRTPILIGLAMLVLGLVVGVGAGRLMGRSSVLAQKSDPAEGWAGPSASGKMQRQAPDPFFSAPTAPWDPLLEGNRLEVSVTHRQPGEPGSTNAPSVGSKWGRYTQVVELAGNLKSEQMKVQQKDHELVITIPKA